jgi:hypothetical protein
MSKAIHHSAAAAINFTKVCSAAENNFPRFVLLSFAYARELILSFLLLLCVFLNDDEEAEQLIF